MYIVIEMQTNGETTAILTNVYNTKDVAYQKFHTILAAAAVSTIDVHTAVIMNEFGTVEDRGTFDHRTEAAGE